MFFRFKTLPELARAATETPATALKMLLTDSHSTGVKHKQPAANASAWLPHITAETLSPHVNRGFQLLIRGYKYFLMYYKWKWVDIHSHSNQNPLTLYATTTTNHFQFEHSLWTRFSVSGHLTVSQSSFDEKFSSYSLLCQRKPRSIIHRRTVAPCLTARTGHARAQTELCASTIKTRSTFCYSFGALSWFYLTLDTV